MDKSVSGTVDCFTDPTVVVVEIIFTRCQGELNDFVDECEWNCLYVVFLREQGSPNSPGQGVFGVAVKDAVDPVVRVGSEGIAKIRIGLSLSPIEGVDTLLDTIHERAGLNGVQGSVAVEQGDVSDIIVEAVLDAICHCERKRCDEPRSESGESVEAVLKLWSAACGAA